MLLTSASPIEQPCPLCQGFPDQSLSRADLPPGGGVPWTLSLSGISKRVFSRYGVLYVYGWICLEYVWVTGADFCDLSCLDHANGEQDPVFNYPKASHRKHPYPMFANSLSLDPLDCLMVVCMIMYDVSSLVICVVFVLFASNVWWGRGQRERDIEIDREI